MWRYFRRFDALTSSSVDCLFRAKLGACFKDMFDFFFIPEVFNICMALDNKTVESRQTNNIHNFVKNADNLKALPEKITVPQRLWMFTACEMRTFDHHLGGTAPKLTPGRIQMSSLELMPSVTPRYGRGKRSAVEGWNL